MKLTTKIKPWYMFLCKLSHRIGGDRLLDWVARRYQGKGIEVYHKDIKLR